MNKCDYCWTNYFYLNHIFSLCYFSMLVSSGLISFCCMHSHQLSFDWLKQNEQSERFDLFGEKTNWVMTDWRKMNKVKDLTCLGRKPTEFWLIEAKWTKWRIWLVLGENVASALGLRLRVFSVFFHWFCVFVLFSGLCLTEVIGIWQLEPNTVL